MEFNNYQTEKRFIGKYSELIKKIYFKYPDFCNAKIEEAKKNFNKKNPFLKFGNWENFLLLDKKRPVAHISAINDKRLAPEIGLVGYFESLNSKKYGDKIFDRVVNFFSKEGKKTIRGPIDFTTWKNFRISYPEKPSPFFMEPYTRFYYRDLFQGYGFKTVQSNISMIQKIEETNFAESKKDFERLKKEKFVFKTITKKELLSFAPDLHNLVINIFRDTWSFVNISLEELIYYFENFLEKENKFLYIVQNKDKASVGFLLGAPDFYSKRKKRVVLKIIGVLPEYRNLGIAPALLYLAYRASKENNISEFIYSTMRDNNNEVKDLVGAAPEVFRKYEVFELSI